MKDASSIKGEFLPNDEIPETLLPILTHLFTNQWPVLEDTANRLSKWYEEQSKSELPIEIPRRLGMHTFSFKGIAEERMLLPYSQWMMQRPLYFYQSLSSQEKNNLEPFLNKIKGLSVLSFPIKTKVTRINNKFMIN
jgi:hypothetical protein